MPRLAGVSPTLAGAARQGADAPSLPSPDYWIPLSATGSGPLVLWRHSAPASSTVSAAPRDYWTPAGLNGSGAPVFRRYWACGTTLPCPAAPIRVGSYNEETATEGKKIPARLADRVALPDGVLTPALQTVTVRPHDSPVQTATRPCVGCGKPLVGKRPQAKAHGPACRQRAYRRRKKEASQALGQRKNGRRSQPRLASLARTAVG